MKKLSIATSVLLSLCFASCLKDKPNVDFSNQGFIAEITTASTNGTPDAPSSGLDFFNGATLDATAGDPDSVSFTVNIASDFPPTQDVSVTLAVNDQARLSYIADPTKVQFKAFPSNAFKLVSTTATIKAGSRLATFWVIFTHANLDPTQSYMLPISITSATGATISGNLSTIYFHIIGNPIAGTYHWEWIRYNEDPPAGSPDFDVQEGTTPFIPVSPTTIAAPSGTGVTYNVSFVNSGGTLSNFSVAFPSSGPGSPSNAGITITSGPSVVLADPINKKYTFNFAYLNSSGAARNITDKFIP
jgi:hypothetical protein